MRSQANIANYVISLVIQTSLCTVGTYEIKLQKNQDQLSQLRHTLRPSFRSVFYTKTITNTSSMKLTWHSSTFNNAMQKPTVFILITIISETMQVPGSEYQPFVTFINYVCPSSPLQKGQTLFAPAVKKFIQPSRVEPSAGQQVDGATNIN